LNIGAIVALNARSSPPASTVERNASTFLDELNDDTALTIAADALAAITAPVLLTHGTESPALFPAVVAELQRLFPAHIGVLDGAGHVPHMTHTEQWVAQLHAFTKRGEVWRVAGTVTAHPGDISATGR
jgi:pimeloyl-ACP methyl ester carboxylesterase